MRILIPVLAVVVIMSAGCQKRDNMSVTPDRGGHALELGNSNPGAAPIYGPQAKVDEQYYTVQPGDTLIGVSKKFKTTTAYLISRNRLSDTTNTHTLTPGQNLIVPKPGARR